MDKPNPSGELVKSCIYCYYCGKTYKGTYFECDNPELCSEKALEAPTDCPEHANKETLSKVDYVAECRPRKYFQVDYYSESHIWTCAKAM